MQHGDEVAAERLAGIGEDTIRRWTQAKAIARGEVMDLLALPEF